jgi:seryl-tRNA synthetase
VSEGVHISTRGRVWRQCGTPANAHEQGYFLKNWGLFLNQALINYGLEFLSQRGFTPLSTPQFMLRDYMAKTAQLSV